MITCKKSNWFYSHTILGWRWTRVYGWFDTSWYYYFERRTKDWIPYMVCHIL